MTEMTADSASRSRLRVILAASIGSALEWYDFFLYGTAAALVFGELFFPKSDPVVGTLLAFLTFGVGFVVRPLGGILFGIMGDRYGRKPVLVATLLMIGVGTTLIGVLPTYAQIGYWAPALLVAMRVVQGLGAGAEYGGAVIFLVENAPPKHRGFWGSFAPLGVSVGNLLAAGAFALVTLLPREDLMSWGWRIPFLASFLLIMVGIYVRLRITETPVFTEAVVARGKVERNPAMEALKRHPRNFFVVLGARLAENGLGYLFPVFGLSYCHHHARRTQVRCAQRVDAGLRHRTLHHCRLRHALRSHRPASGLYVRRARRHRLGVPVLLAGRHQGVDLDRGRLHRRTRGRDGGDVRPAGGVFRRTVPTAAAFCRICLRARTGLAIGRRTGAVRGRSTGGVVRKLVAGRMLRSLAGRPHRDRDLERSGDLSRKASPSTIPPTAG